AYFYKPELFKSFLHRVNELALNHVKTGYAELYRDSSASIDRAIDNFEKAISIDASYVDARAGHAEAELARAEYLVEEAAGLAAKLPQLAEPERAAATAKIDSLRRESIQRGERAFNAAKEALRLDPESVSAARAMADYYRFNNAPDSMRPLIERARAKAPKDAGVAYVLGASVAGDATARDRAVRYFDEALEAAPDMQRARYKLARLYLAQGEKDKALLQVETVLKSVPEHERAQALLAELKPPPVVAQPEEKKPLSFEQLLAQAERLRMSDQPEKALTLYERASDMEPEDPDVLTGMGWCYVDMEEAAPAITSFKEALEIAPRLTDAHMGLAEAYRMRGDKASAIKHYKAYLDILPTGAEAPVARRMIETLEKK
ncbi:MAG: tetratricopeptide repeat protein, partial [Deltaproteobacteria bacterium]|nr:tetratricopeptide repeat protein [Deltaproteobacteria bacterium]